MAERTGTRRRAVVMTKKPRQQPPHPFHHIVVNPDGKLYGVKPQVLNQTDKVRFEIAGIRFDVQIQGRGLTGYLEVRTVDGPITIQPASGNVIECRLGKHT